MTDLKTQLNDQFAGIRSALPGANVAWLDQVRGAAMEQFLDQGLPTRRDEAWRYTDVTRSLKQFSFMPSLEFSNESLANKIRPFLYTEICSSSLVFVNGVYQPSLSNESSLPEGVRIRRLDDVLNEGEEWLRPLWSVQGVQPQFSALSAALATSGVVIEVAKGVTVEKPIQLLYVGASAANPAAAHIKNIVNADDGADVTVLESYIGLDDASYWHHAETVIDAEANATVKHYKVIYESNKATHIGRTLIYQAAASEVTQHAIQLTGQLVRSDLAVDLEGAGAKANLDGLILATGRQHVDNHLLIRHLVPEADSNTHYKYALADRAKGVFNGAIYVAKDAQKTEAHLSNNNILLSDHAEIDTKPELEIYADDVACSHGATVGQLEEASLHYLRSRGIDTEMAKNLLLFAFCSDIVSRISQPEIKNRLLERVLSKLPNGAQLEGVV